MLVAMPSAGEESHLARWKNQGRGCFAGLGNCGSTEELNSSSYGWKAKTSLSCC